VTDSRSVLVGVRRFDSCHSHFFDAPSCPSPFRFVPLRPVLTPLSSAHTMGLLSQVFLGQGDGHAHTLARIASPAPSRSSHHASHRACRCVTYNRRCAMTRSARPRVDALGNRRCSGRCGNPLPRPLVASSGALLPPSLLSPLPLSSGPSLRTGRIDVFVTSSLRLVPVE
jgi:hypothetical protein